MQLATPSSDLTHLGMDFSQALVALLPDVRRRARKLTRSAHQAEDLAQDALERALRFQDSFRDGSNLRAWMMRIVTNTFISQTRRWGTERRVLERSGHDPNGWVELPSARQLPGLSPPVLKALGELSPALQEVVVLVDLEDVSYRDAAEVMQVPIGTVMSRLHRGRGRLKARLSEGLPGEGSRAA